MDFSGDDDTPLVVFILNEITLIKLKLTHNARLCRIFRMHIHAELVWMYTYAGW